jgi:2-keto-4-pentenoate hydratase
VPAQRLAQPKIEAEVAFVVGRELAGDTPSWGEFPVAIGQLAGAELGMQMSVNGQVASVGSGAACLGHSLRAAYWLARTMAAHGQRCARAN